LPYDEHRVAIMNGTEPVHYCYISIIKYQGSCSRRCLM